MTEINSLLRRWKKNCFSLSLPAQLPNVPEQLAVNTGCYFLQDTLIREARTPPKRCVELSCYRAKNKRDTDIQKKRRLLNAHQWKGSSRVHWPSTKAKGPREYWCKVFTLNIWRSAFWLKDWLPSAILSQAALHKSLSLPYSLPEVCSWMLPLPTALLWSNDQA